MSLTRTTRFQKLYGALSEKEKSEFREFLNLSYLNVSRIPKKVLENLKENPDFLDYLRKNYSERTVWNTLSEISKLIEKFLESKRLLSDNGSDNRNYLKNRISSRIRTHYLQLKKELERAHSVKYYHGLFDEVFERSHFHYDLVAKGKDQKVLEEVNILITNFYSAKVVLDILLLLKEDKFRKQIRNSNQDTDSEKIFSMIDFRKVIEVIKETAPGLYPIAKMYYLLYNLSKDPANQAVLKVVHSHLIKNSEVFSDRFKSEVYFTMLNCYIMLKNAGHSGMEHEMYMIMKEKLDSGITNDLQNEFNEDSHFRDYVIIALSLDEIDWASDFVNRYSYLLPHSRRDNESNICKAFIEFKKKDLSEALSYLAKIKRNDYMHIIDYYSIYIKCHFELGNSDECTMALRRFSESLKHVKQIPDNYIKGSENFIRVMSKLISYRADRSENRLLDLEMLINNSAMLIENKWLLRKISETNSSH